MLTIQTSVNLIVDAFAVHKVVEHLITSFGLVRGHHMTCTFHCYHCEVAIVGLVETTVLVFHCPRTPTSSFYSMQGLNILFSVRVRDLVIVVSAVDPYSYASVGEDLSVLVE